MWCFWLHTINFIAYVFVFIDSSGLLHVWQQNSHNTHERLIEQPHAYNSLVIPQT